MIRAAALLTLPSDIERNTYGHLTEANESEKQETVTEGDGDGGTGEMDETQKEHGHFLIK